MEPRNSPISNNEDRISNLPESLIHHILSFLHMKYAVQTSCLSRRWRYLWTSLPILNLFDFLFISPETGNMDSFIDFVDRVLVLRDSSDIQRFHLVWRDEDATSNRLNTWIFAAVKHNVQELYVCATVYEKFPFPQCLFTCKSLTKLELEMGNRSESEIILPNSMCLPGLKSLKLESLSFGDEELTNKLFSSCPVLESLIIVDCHMNFNISSLNLKHFKLHNYDYYCPYNNLVTTIKLYAPNLTSFSCKDYMTQDYSLENLSSLVTADIYMIVEENEKDETPGTYSKLSTGVKELYAQRMMNFLRAFHNVKDLKLSPGILELNTADIGDDWEARLSFPCMLYHLKFVEIRDVVGCVNELKFLEILLKNALVLEVVVLFSFETDSPDRARQLLEFNEKLLSFPRASSSVSILCQY